MILSITHKKREKLKISLVFYFYMYYIQKIKKLAYFLIFYVILLLLLKFTLYFLRRTTMDYYILKKYRYTNRNQFESIYSSRYKNELALHYDFEIHGFPCFSLPTTEF